MNPTTFSFLQGVYPWMRATYHRASFAVPGGWALPFYTVHFELTYRCNLRCRMCFVAEYLRRKRLDDVHAPGEELTTAEVARVIEDMPRKRSLAILTGGELFLRDDVWTILEHATRRVFCVLGTNATMLDARMAERIVNLGVVSLWIGLDGSETRHDVMRGEQGAFRKTVEGIRTIQETKRRLGVNSPIINTFTVIARENVGDLTTVADVAEELGVEKCFIEVYDTALDRFGADLDLSLPQSRKRDRYVMSEDERLLLREQLTALKGRQRDGTEFRTLPHEFSIDDIVDYYRPDFSMAGRPCTVPWWLMRISPTGDVYPCYNYPVGNVREASLSQIWRGERYRAFRQAMRGGTAEACRGCNYMQSGRLIR